jgi:peptidylprolyl isomerase
MKQHLLLLIFCAIITCGYTNNGAYQHVDKKLASKIIGKKIRSLLDDTNYPINYESLIQAMQEGNKDISKEEEEALLSYHKTLIEEISFNNLAIAENFLITNPQEEKEITVLSPLLQYKTNFTGNETSVKKTDRPLILLTQKLLDGTILNEEKQLITLSEASSSLRSILTSMKEKEKRTVYIHPSLEIEKDEKYPPNSLIIFEVEVIQSDFKDKVNFPPNAIISNKIIR